MMLDRQFGIIRHSEATKFFEELRKQRMGSQQ